MQEFLTREELERMRIRDGTVFVYDEFSTVDPNLGIVYLGKE